MGSAALVENKTRSQHGDEGQLIWEHLTQANAAGAAVDCRKYRNFNVQVTGTWNGATFTLQGSLDGDTWFNLRALSSLTAISLAAASTMVIEIFESPFYLKPVLTGAGAATDLKCVVGGKN